jgi:hypothetical protein
VSQGEIREIVSDGQCSIKIPTANGERCPRSWKWVDHLADAGLFGKVSPKCFEALAEKDENLLK